MDEAREPKILLGEVKMCGRGIAQAGRQKMVTIATNMAGRGTDIVLGGNVEKQCELIEASE